MADACKAYEAGVPMISDEQYDALERKVGMMIAGAGDIPHISRMYSLKKHYPSDGEYPLDPRLCTATDKLDGAAISITYIDGQLEQGLTRGDGIKGRCITNKLQHLKIPEIVPFNNIVEVRGEVIAKSSVKNSRNFASGALNLKDLSEYYSRVGEGDMVFVAYDVVGVSTPNYTDAMNLLHSIGFNVCTEFDSSEYPKDGIVYRLNSNSEYYRLGFTDKFPRGAFAYKEEKEAVQTKLLDVIWETGKSGKVTPVAILEPVMIDDAKISRATLNNIAYIEALELEIGCTVDVIRAGEIIPCVVGKSEE